MERNIAAVCISQHPQSWYLGSIPFYCHTQSWRPFGRAKSKERVAYLAERRNRAVAETLRIFPSTEHVLMIDSYYLQQPDQIRKLLEEYDGKCILGASIWFFDKTKIIPKVSFWDSWTTPEASNIVYDQNLSGRLRVRAVGACYVYPRYVWEQVGYGVPYDLHGCEHNYLCEGSHQSVWLSLTARLWRPPVVYPWIKRVRCTLHFGRLLRTRM